MRFCLPTLTMWPQVRFEGSWFSRWTPAAPDANQLGGEREGLGRPAEAGLHVHEGRWRVEHLLALGVEPMGVPRSLDPLSHLQDELDHLVRLINADIRIHALGRRQLPAATVQRLEPDPGHDGRRKSVVGARGVEVAALGVGLAEEPAKLVGRDLCFGWREELVDQVGRIVREGGCRAGRSRHDRSPRGKATRPPGYANGAGAAATGQFVKLFT